MVDSENERAHGILHVNRWRQKERSPKVNVSKYYEITRTFLLFDGRALGPTQEAMNFSPGKAFHAVGAPVMI